MRKGKGSFVTVVSDIEGGNLIEMIDFHRQQDRVEVLMRQPLKVREQVEKVRVNASKLISQKDEFLYY